MCRCNIHIDPGLLAIYSAILVVMGDLLAFIAVYQAYADQKSKNSSLGSEERAILFNRRI